MKERQELIVDNHRYPVYRYQGRFKRDVETNKLSTSMTLSIPTENISHISPWIVKQTVKKDITIIRHLSKNGELVKTVFLDFIGVQCTGYFEEYDVQRKEVVLHLTAIFNKRIITDKEQQQKIIDLLA